MTTSFNLGIVGGIVKQPKIFLGIAGGIVKPVQNAYVGIAGGIVKQVYSAIPPLVVTLTQYSIVRSRTGPGALVTSVTFATASGGNGVYAYAWTRVLGSVAITTSTPLVSGTTFGATVASGDDDLAYFVCTVTDGLGNVGVSPQISVEIIGI